MSIALQCTDIDAANLDRGKNLDGGKNEV